MTKRGADAIIAHVGTTVGGSIGVVNAVVDWDFTVKRTQEIIDAAKSVRKDVFTLTHGGPINTPKDVEFILSKTSADGFVGASSLERMGVEDSLTNLTREFKKEMQRFDLHWHDFFPPMRHCVGDDASAFDGAMGTPDANIRDRSWHGAVLPGCHTSPYLWSAVFSHLVAARQRLQNELSSMFQ